MPTPPSAPMAPAIPISAPDIRRDQSAFSARFSPSIALGLGVEDRRDHLVHRAVPDARQDEQRDESDHVGGHDAAGWGARHRVVETPGDHQPPGGGDHCAEHVERHLAPPIRSDSQPPGGREIEPRAAR